jgi:hypothetical protein
MVGAALYTTVIWFLLPDFLRQFTARFAPR